MKKLLLKSQAVMFIGCSLMASQLLAKTDSLQNDKYAENTQKSAKESKKKDAKKDKEEELELSMNDKFQLDASVVSASSFDQSVSEAPATISVITREKLLTNTPPRDLGDAIKDVPGVDVAPSRNGSNKIEIRGFEQKYTTLLLNGHKQNVDDQLDGTDGGHISGSNFLPAPGMIERIEIIRGPASVVHGSSAIGGVVNVITKRHASEVTGDVGVQGRFQEDSVYGDSHAFDGNLFIPVVKDQVTFYIQGRDYNKIGGGLKNAEGYPRGYGKYDNTEYGGGVNITPKEGHDINFNYFQAIQGGSIKGVSRSSIVDYAEYTKNSFSADYSGDVGFLGTLKFKTQVSEAKQTDSGSSGQYGTSVEKRPFADRNSKVFYNQLSLITPITFGNQLLNISQGVEYNEDSLVINEPQEKKEKYEIDATTKSYAYFLEGEYFITDDLIATLGARYNKVKGGEDNISPRAYLVWKATDGVTFKGGVSTGFIAPSSKQMIDGYYGGWTQPNSNSGRYQGNPNLKPETSISYELGTILENEDIGALSLTAFYTTHEDKIVADRFNSKYPSGTTMPNGKKCPNFGGVGDYCIYADNIGKTASYGAEAFFQSESYYGVSFDLGYTYIKTEIKDPGKSPGKKEGDPVRAIPHHRVTAAINYAYNDFKAFIKGKAEIDTPRLPGKERDTFGDYEDFFIVDLGATYTLAKNHTFGLYVNNITDKYFYDYKRAGDITDDAYNKHYDGRSIELTYRMSF